MAVRWPDGSYTGSVRVGLLTAPTPVEPEPVQEPRAPEKKTDDDKKEAVKDDAR